MTKLMPPRILHAWWASDRPLAYLMCGYHENESTHPTIWIRTFDPVFIAAHGHGDAEHTDLVLGYLRHKEAMQTFVNFMDALCAQIEATRLPQPTERKDENETGTQSG